MNIEQYLTVPYIDGGRDITVGLDCWGLVRNVLHAEFNQPLFEGFAGVDRYKPQQVNQGYVQSVNSFALCQPKAGVVACCFDFSGVMHHVGVCINTHQVLHTSSKKGVGILPVRGFKRLSHAVRFYEFVGNKVSERHGC